MTLSAATAPQWTVTPRQRCDLEMLLNGGFAPLSGFLGQSDYESAVHTMRMSDGRLCPIPVTLDVDEAFAEKVTPGAEIALHDFDGTRLATMTVTDKWMPDKTIEAQHVFNTQDAKHPAVAHLFHESGRVYLGGPVRGVQAPRHYDFSDLRLAPAELKRQFARQGWEKIIGFQTRNPMHRAHLELTLRAAEQIGGNILLHPVSGMTKPDDVDYYTRIRCYQKLLPYYPPGKVMLALLPIAMRFAGPREALWHALIRKNYGCTHFIIGRDHASPGVDSAGKLFYDPYAAQTQALAHASEMDIGILPFEEMVYVKERRHYVPRGEVEPQETALSISGSELRQHLLTDSAIPEWFSFPDVIEELKNSYLPRHKRGFTVFFTGLSGAGKTTLAGALQARLMELGKQNIVMLDGDIVRRELNSELGFSKAERNRNIERIGYVAGQIVKVGGIVLCAAIAPYSEARAKNRRRISALGGYVEVYLSTSLSACESRDVKGLYARARKGEISHFTGIDDPYEQPERPELTLDTAELSLEQAADKIIGYLRAEGYLLSPEKQSASANGAEEQAPLKLLVAG